MKTDNIGPNLRKIGIDGTLYGETGYNSYEGNDLWVWPLETVIKAEMCEVSYLAVYRNGNDSPAFCDSNKGLTQYIWEYLGNSCPNDICG